jgi:tyrosine-protein kinase Etk/Wzc
VKEYLGLLRRHRWLVLGVTLLCGAIAGYKAYTDPPVYISSAAMRFGDPQSSLAGGLGGAALGNRMGGDPILSQIQVLESRRVMEMVVEDVGLRLQSLDPFFPIGLLTDVQVSPNAETYQLALSFSAAGVHAEGPAGSADAPYGKPLQLGPVRFTVARDPGMAEVQLAVVPRVAAAGGILRNLTVHPRERTDVVDVSFSSHDPLLSQRVTNSVMERFQAYNAQSAQQEAHRRRVFLEERLAHTDSLLLKAQEALTSFRKRESVLSSRERFAAQQAGLMQLDLQRDELQSNVGTLRSLLTNLQRGGATDEELQAVVSAKGISENPLVQKLYSDLQDYELVRDTLTSGDGALARTNPEVVRANQLIASTRGSLVNALKNQLSAFERQLTSLANLRAQREAEIKQAPTADAEEVRLLARMDQIGTVAGQLREEYNRAQMLEAVEAGQVEVIDQALPGVPSTGHQIRTLLFGLALGLFLGGGGAVLWERSNTSIRRKDEIEKMLHVPELAIVPQLALDGKRRRMRFPVPVINGNGNGKGPAHGEGSELVAATQVQSPGAEAFRTLRTNLIFSQAVEKLRLITVTSSAPSEGKSTIAANLAVTFAQQGMRALLVDCDLRKARLHRVFQVPREPGLTQFVLKHNTADETIQSTSIEGLSIMTAGTLPPNPAELVGGPRMREALHSLSDRFDIIVIDTPPLLAASDAAVVGTLTDGVLLVVRAGQTERDAAMQSVHKLASVGTRILGAVLNDPDSKVAAYGGYYAYEYYGAEK